MPKESHVHSHSLYLPLFYMLSLSLLRYAPLSLSLDLKRPNSQMASAYHPHLAEYPTSPPKAAAANPARPQPACTVNTGRAQTMHLAMHSTMLSTDSSCGPCATLECHFSSGSVIASACSKFKTSPAVHSILHSLTKASSTRTGHRST